MDWVVSHSDVEKHPKYNKNKPTDNLSTILLDYGLDVSKGFYTDGRDTDKKPDDWPDTEPHFGYSHRSAFTGELSYGPRYIGEARSDGMWKKFVINFLELGGDV